MENSKNIKDYDYKGRNFLIMTIFAIVIFIPMLFSSMNIIGCSDSSDPNATPTMTPTITETPTITPTATATVTPTEVPGWRSEEEVVTAAEYSLDDVKLDLESNENGELCLAYIKDFHCINYTIKSTDGAWSEPKLVQGSLDNIESSRFYIQTTIDNNGDVNFVWTGGGGSGVPWRYCYYNRFDNASQTWVYENSIDVIWGADYTLAPDIATTPAGTERFMAGQSGWGIGFNWDLGEGLQTTMNYPYVNESGEPKRPRLAISPDGKVHMIFFDYMGPTGSDQPQIGYGIFDPKTATWSELTAPAPVPYGAYPGGPAIAAGPDGSIHTLWYNWHSGTQYDELVYAMKNSDGEWQPYEIVWSSGGLITEPFEAEFPAIKVNSDGVVMILAKAQNSYEETIYYLIKRPGESWTEPEKIPVTSEKQFTPALSVHGQKFTIAWQDTRGSIYTMDYVP